MTAARPLIGALALLVLAAPLPATPALADTAPWSAPATTQRVEEAKVFRSGDADLSGTLYLPKGGKALAAVVVTHAAGSPSRASPLYRHLIEMLPAMGMAVFVYDRRGSGASGGDLKTSDYALLADDAVAAVRMLKTDPRIDPGRVGVWGLSQGGWLALLAATRSPEVAFVVSISAPVVTPDVQMMFRSANALKVQGYSQVDIDQMLATRKAVDDYMRGTSDKAEAQRRIDAAKVQPWFPLTYMGETVRDRDVSRWRKEIEFDPLPSLETVKVPALVLYGAADPVVPVAISVERLATITPRRPNLKVAVIAGADHGMQTTVSPKDQMDPARADMAAPDAAEYFAVLASWLTAKGLAAR
ncbi:alpha/beta hydrolase family protein [Caulobacter mirabilis]|uniref:Xaa-Pro dipeptidyl-peptidase-like domain-containing protein n=1 Tax=Caulobacter mirabilis TaxID=69666 RepID=A0A2D2AYD3_9CAUL|nr:alpha/beta fold hydrolase [Caulobacter mirabilis]ATQ43002.1 hypothetical protein CSW64_11580 [Caulobacter mirabilis]